MKPEVAIAELEKLRGEATEPLTLRPPGMRSSWKARVMTVMNKSLGPQHHITSAFQDVSYGYRGLYTASMGDTPHSNAFTAGIRKAVGYIEAAIYELGLLTGDEEPVDQRAFDPELWDHVKGLVETGDWGKVASQTAIFVENHVRRWSGVPKDGKGDDLVGKALWAKVLANDAEYRLGKRAGEWEGWRFLGIGFAQALSNVDRHHIQDRDDARRYAIGVLGLGSLLLTQLRHEHSDILNEA